MADKIDHRHHVGRAAAANGDVAIFDPPAAAPLVPSFIGANLALFANYIAASFPAVGHCGSGMIADLSQVGSEPALTHPGR